MSCDTTEHSKIDITTDRQIHTDGSANVLYDYSARHVRKPDVSDPLVSCMFHSYAALADTLSSA